MNIKYISGEGGNIIVAFQTSLNNLSCFVLVPTKVQQ